jgi:hypothetical protein
MVEAELWTAYALLFGALLCGTIALLFTFRWCRTLKQPSSSRSEALAQLARALDQEEQLDPEETRRVRAAIERQRETDDPPPGETSGR